MELECNEFLVSRTKAFFFQETRSYLKKMMGVRWGRDIGFLKLLTKKFRQDIWIFRHRYIDIDCSPEKRNNKAACAAFHSYGEHRLGPGQKEKALGCAGSIGTNMVRLMAWSGLPSCHEPSTQSRSLWNWQA